MIQGGPNLSKYFNLLIHLKFLLCPQIPGGGKMQQNYLILKFQGDQATAPLAPPVTQALLMHVHIS